MEDSRRLEQMLKESDADRVARLENNQKLEQLLKEGEADRAAQLEIIHNLESQLKALKESTIVRFLIRLGLVSDGKKLSARETGEEKR